MIIRFPTGLYKSVLPVDAEAGNVTYTISSEDPPRTNVRAIQIPIAEEIKPSPDRIFTEQERRARFGELVFTVARSKRSNPGSNTKVFEVGEILEFEENPPEEEIQTVRAPDIVELRQDTNILDLKSIGLTETEIESITEKSEIKLVELEKEFLTKQTRLQNIDTEIGENQKKINETNKATNAVRQIYDIPDGDLSFDNDIYQKLLKTGIELEIEREALIVERNNVGSEVEAIYRSIIKVSELVR